MQASQSPRTAPPGLHVRRPSRPHAVLETLVERGESEIGTAGATSMRAPRPASMIISTPTPSHMPRSIFPDVPNSRRSATFSAASPTPPPAARPNPVSRRHTTYLAPSPLSASTRRESRPLRSSPLAGPSLALSDDGTLTGSDESAGSERRVKPNRISSTPDISTSTLMKLEGKMVASAPASPTGTLRGAPPPILALEELGVLREEEKTPTPPSPTKQSPARRLSLGFKRLSALPGLPKASSPDQHSPTSAESKNVSRARTLSGTSSKSAAGTSAPPVPSIPVWAKPSFMSPTDAPPAASGSKLHPDDATEKKTLSRRPSTAPSTGSTRSLNRRSVLYGSHETIPGVPPSSALPPSTSRDPEQNWLSTAAPPRFSRLGLKAEGVVLPLTAKEVRRRSTIRQPSGDSDARTVRSMKSATSLKSLAASFQTIPEDAVQPPSPPFRREASASSSSIASSAGSVASSVAESDITELHTPSLSRASSDCGSVRSQHAPAPASGSPRHDAFEHDEKAAGEAAGGVELRVNDVTVEIIELREKRERGLRAQASTVELKVGVAPVTTAGRDEKARKAVPERRGTLKRVWKKLTGGAKG